MYICIYVCMYWCIYVYMYVCIDVYMYICICVLFFGIFLVYFKIYRCTNTSLSPTVSLGPFVFLRLHPLLYVSLSLYMSAGLVRLPVSKCLGVSLCVSLSLSLSLCLFACLFFSCLASVSVSFCGDICSCSWKRLRYVANRSCI